MKLLFKGGMIRTSKYEKGRKLKNSGVKIKEKAPSFVENTSRSLYYLLTRCFPLDLAAILLKDFCFSIAALR